MIQVGYLTPRRLNRIGRARERVEQVAFPSVVFHMHSIFTFLLGCPSAIAFWGCKALQDVVFHLIFTGRIVNIFATSTKVDTDLRLLEMNGVFPKTSRLLPQVYSSCGWICRTPGSIPGNLIPWYISQCRQLLVETVQLLKPFCHQSSPCTLLSKSHS